MTISNPTSDFKIFALMDYDEDVVFTLDYKLKPGNYVKPGSESTSLDSDAKIAIYVAVAFVVFILGFLSLYKLCHKPWYKKDTRSNKDIKDFLPSEDAEGKDANEPETKSPTKDVRPAIKKQQVSPMPSPKSQNSIKEDFTQDRTVLEKEDTRVVQKNSPNQKPRLLKGMNGQSKRVPVDTVTQASERKTRNTSENLLDDEERELYKQQSTMMGDNSFMNYSSKQLKGEEEEDVVGGGIIRVEDEDEHDSDSIE